MAETVAVHVEAMGEARKEAVQLEGGTVVHWCWHWQGVVE